MAELARRMRHARRNAIMEIAELANRLKAGGREIVDFSIGTPNFLPGPHVYQAVEAWLKHDSGQYGRNRGSDELIDAFIQHIDALGLTGYQRTNCAVGIGAKNMICSVVEAIMDVGDELLVPSPCWSSYADIAELLGARMTRLACPPEQHYKVRPAQLDEALARKPKVLLFNNPCNPTGMVYTREEMVALAEVLVEYPDTWVISDDVYHRMVFDGVGYHNFLHARPELRDRLIFIDSVSKTYGMPGWRVGLIAAPRVVADAVVALNSTRISSLPAVASVAATAALSGPQDVPARMCAEFAARRDEVLDALAAIPGLVCPRPQGAFYAFPDISFAFGMSHRGSPLNSDRDVCNALLETQGVACVPGSAFGEPRSLRISYSQPPALLEAGLQRMREFFSELR